MHSHFEFGAKFERRQKVGRKNSNMNQVLISKVGYAHHGT